MAHRYVVFVGILARLDPRHWGGRRVLQFLTGLALVALAIVAAVDVPAAVAAPARPAVVTAAPPPGANPPGAARSDATGAGLDATGAALDATGAGLDATGAGLDATRAGFDAIAAEAVEARAIRVVGAPDVVLQSTAVTGAAAVPPTGSTPASLGSRAPPRR